MLLHLSPFSTGDAAPFCGRGSRQMTLLDLPVMRLARVRKYFSSLKPALVGGLAGFLACRADMAQPSVPDRSVRPPRAAASHFPSSTEEGSLLPPPKKFNLLKTHHRAPDRFANSVSRAASAFIPFAS